MGTFRKPLDLYHAQKARFESNMLTLKEGHRELAVMGLDDARELTSGTLKPDHTRGAFARGKSAGKGGGSGLRRQLSSKQLARRGIVGGVPLLPVNVQDGTLLRSFLLRDGKGRGLQSFELTEKNPGGGIFRLVPGGTVKMVDSGFFMEIRRRWRPRNKAFIDHFRSKQKH